MSAPTVELLIADVKAQCGHSMGKKICAPCAFHWAKRAAAESVALDRARACALVELANPCGLDGHDERPAALLHRAGCLCELRDAIAHGSVTR
jgi:hypothetical protein